MKKDTRQIIFFSTVALVAAGTLYYFFVFKKTTVNQEVKGKRADFASDGFVYSVANKSQSYPKKAGEFGGLILGEYSQDKTYWLARNSAGQEILLKKSDVKII